MSKFQLPRGRVSIILAKEKLFSSNLIPRLVKLYNMKILICATVTKMFYIKILTAVGNIASIF